MRWAAIRRFELMFCRPWRPNLATMSGIDPRAGPPLVNGGKVGVTGYLRTATLTLLSADVEGSERLWADKPDVMAAAMRRLNQIVGDVIAAHGGVGPVEHREGDGF